MRSAKKTPDMNPLLERGLTSYKSREYDRALATLDSLTQSPDAAARQKTVAHKVRAFVFAIQRRDTLAEMEFGRAYELDSLFALESAEMGNPTWMPAYERARSLASLRRLRVAELLQMGQRHYKERKYEAALSYLTLVAQRLDAAVPDRVQACKLLAFSYALLKRPEEARQAFLSALKIDPRFALDKAEYGNPVWTPLYEQAQREFRK